MPRRTTKHELELVELPPHPRADGRAERDRSPVTRGASHCDARVERHRTRTWLHECERGVDADDIDRA